MNGREGSRCARGSVARRLRGSERDYTRVNERARASGRERERGEGASEDAAGEKMQHKGARDDAARYLGALPVMAFDSQVMASSRPTFLVAAVLQMCHCLSLSVCKPSPSETSASDSALFWSCALP